VSSFDALAIALLALAAGLGALLGALRPLFLSAGAALGWLASSRLSAPLGRTFERVLPSPTGGAAASAVLFVAPVLVAGAIAGVLRRRSTGERRPGDRAAGALLLGGAAGLAAFMALAILSAVSPSLPAGWRKELGKSDLAALVREHREVGGAWRKPAEDALRELLTLSALPGGAAAIARDPDLRGLAADRRVRELLEQAGAGKAGDAEGTARGLKLLSDPEFRERLLRSQEALDRAAREE